MTNKQIIKLLPKLPALKREQKRLAAQLDQIDKKLRKVNNTVYALERVSAVHKGVPLIIYGGLTVDIYPASRPVRRDDRRARVWKDVRKPRAYRVELNTWARNGPIHDRRTKKECLEIAKDWVAKGITP